MAASLSEQAVCASQQRPGFDTSIHLAKREKDTLEERSRLVQTLLEGFIKLNVELARILAHVLSALLEQNALKVDPDLCRLQV